MAVIKTEHIYKEFSSEAERVTILEDISFSVEKGSFSVIMGPSGSGKSTLLHIISGLEPPSSGKIFLNGTEISGLSERKKTLLRRGGVGFIFQFFNLVPNLNVRENIALPLLIQSSSIKSEEEEFINYLVEVTHLRHKMESFPNQLSGGEMQRVSIARALVSKPGIVLADEPTGNVSTKVGKEIMDLLKRCCDEFGQSILLVTHNPRDAAYGDNVFFLKDGKLAHDHHLQGDKVNESSVLNCLQKLKI